MRPAASAIASKLSGPGEELLLVEPEILAELDVRHSVGARSLVQPTLRDANQRRRLVDGQPPDGLAIHDGDAGGCFVWRRCRNFV
jgi:hypothetical protein